MAVDDNEETRFRSFAELYVVERAAGFEKETAQAEAWDAVNQALNVYGMIKDKAKQAFAWRPEDQPKQFAWRPEDQPKQQAVYTAPNHPVYQGATGAPPPNHSPRVAHLQQMHQQAVRIGDLHQASSIQKMIYDEIQKASIMGDTHPGEFDSEGWTDRWTGRLSRSKKK